MDCIEFEQQFSLYSKDKYDEMDDLDGFEKHLSTCEECFEKYSERLSFERVISDNWGELESGLAVKCFCDFSLG